MTRLELQNKFREENPEITANVISNTVLNSWCQTGDKEICAKARLIVDTGSITPIEDRSYYDLTSLSKFFDIDENPGGGVSIVDTSSREKRLTKTSKSELDSSVSGWRTSSSGRPSKYFRRGKYIYFDKPVDDTISEINVDFIAISDDFDNDNKTPYNQLTYLEPFHPALVFYLTWRAKAKVGKPEESLSAMNMYNAYVAWMAKTIGGGKYSSIEFIPSGLPSTGNQR